MNFHESAQPVASRSRSRDRLHTPALVLDLDAFERNIAAMAETCRGFGIALRPHAKTHKCTAIARRQIAAGAVGICCATLDEAEVMAAAGLPGILITAPIVSAEKIDRLIRFVRNAPDAMVIVDNPVNVEALNRAAGQAGAKLKLLVDLDVGNHRTGVAVPQDAVHLAQQIAAGAHSEFVGLQAYGGQLQHIVDQGDRLRRTREAAHAIRQTVEALTGAGLHPKIVTGSGTGTHRIDGEVSPFTEFQVGSYIFMDSDYGDVEFDGEHSWPYAFALFVQTMVISTNVPGTVTTDGGTKAFALNGPKPRIAKGPLAGSHYDFAGDEHGRIQLADASTRCAIGDRVECIVPHCDPTVALYDAYHCVRGDTVVEIWPIDARGRR